MPVHPDPEKAAVTRSWDEVAVARVPSALAGTPADAAQNPDSGKLPASRSDCRDPLQS